MKKYGRKTCVNTILAYLPQWNTTLEPVASLFCQTVPRHFYHSRVTTFSVQLARR